MTQEAPPGVHAVDFRAPPPSPVAPGRRSSFANDDVLTEYLQQSLRVPDLVLPDKVFPRQKTLQNPPKIRFRDLESLGTGPEGAEICRLIAQLGCLEVINHGISRDWIDFVMELGNGVFELPPEKKRVVARSPERRYGFEESDEGEEVRDRREEFIWMGEEEMRVEMEGIWPFRYSNFSQEMAKLSAEIAEIGRTVVQFLEQQIAMRIRHGSGEEEGSGSENVCCCSVQKHQKRRVEEEEGEGEMNVNAVRYDVIRMLISGGEFPHALCLHLCSGAADFHVYSRKGWISFSPDQDSLVVTIGDMMQEWSDGQYKHVIGRPVFKGEVEEGKKNNGNISMGFLYSPPNISVRDDDDGDTVVTISLTNQIILALLLIMIYQFSVFVYTRFF
ncbi:leucoanthocyanidin dioxygenase [Andrographis paniculata]|uniref:leucoanthocyanidin dioxygenase n=1 Tax=Andrographis paniculata TaxID=175694 RepID=UPI0021E98183|nr:leucoanthocyanidin dioxygenase [Andrographis paniculata]